MVHNNEGGRLAPPAVSPRRATVCLISSNPELGQACRAQLDHICPSAYSIEQCFEPSEPPSGCDIYVWDCDSSRSLPSVMAVPGPAAKVVILEKSSMPDIVGNVQCEDLTFLQKPVSSLSLQAVLCSAVTRVNLRTGTVRDPALNANHELLLQKLLETNVKLCQYDEQRGNFLTRAIHDIRVPLTAVQGYCDLLLAGQAGPMHPEQAQILGRMRRSLTRLRRIAGAVMDLGAGAQLGAKPKFESASLEACVQQAVHEILPIARRKQISVQVEMDPPSDSLWLDPSQIEQVLVNLLENGCKFTPRGGSIRIDGHIVEVKDTSDGTEAGTGYRIDIGDTGPGISPEHLEHIFDEHVSYSDPMDRSGSGLGLAICRMIMHAHNGKIWASSDERGATFSLVLPEMQSLND